MPNRDGTGPDGKGPRTGRQMGDCKDAESVVGKRRFIGKRFDRTRGLGRRNA